MIVILTRAIRLLVFFENISGTFVDFVKSDEESEREIVQLQLHTAETRKYIASKLLIINSLHIYSNCDESVAQNSQIRKVRI